ncbi:energy transducer TonB [Nonlabens antarcticus]|uniref:energy transducer TonB n=1 Tax=Nonlabens antarcticus TaxID=392714 RepID=UPI00189188CF|nr:energy transducer TonB [Nonlabens antarcticus]
MRTLHKSVDAATSTASRRSDKKLTNVKVNPFINFLLGLTAAMLVAFLIIELQTPIKERSYPTVSNQETAMEVNMDRFIIEKPQPKTEPKKTIKKQPVERVQKVDRNKPPVIVENTEPDPIVDVEPFQDNNPVIDNSNTETPVEISKPELPSSFNLVAVSEVPLFPGCSAKLDNNERIECLNEKMARFIQRKFDTSLANEMDGKDIVNITVLFTIGVDGFPKNIQVRAPNALLEKEAKRLISSLPQMKPGKFDGAVVNTTYALPIRFKVQ